MLAPFNRLLRLAAFMLASVLAAPATLTAANAADQQRAPNIVFILADDLGWGDVGFHGARNKTPHLDKLAREGIQLEQHYVYPTCSPTRCALLSGRYSSRFGVLAPTNARVFKEDTPTLPGLLRALGYATALTGKWHLGSKPEWGPRKHGFDHTYGCLAGGIDQWSHLYKGGDFQRTWHRNDVFVDEEGHSTDLYTREAIRFIEQQRDQPFFLYVPYTAVHLPIQESAEWLKHYDGTDLDAKQKQYAACVTHLDAAIGQLLAALERSKQRDNTLVIFTSDNGAPGQSEYGQAGGKPLAKADAKPNQYPGTYENGPGGVNLPFRGTKGTVYEGGLRVPTIVYWPGKLPAGKIEAPAHIVDWLPTLLQVAGRHAPPMEVEGKNLWPLLTGKETKPAPRTLYWAQGALRRGDWKLVLPRKGQPELFDLAHDRAEKKSVADEHPKLVEELRAEFEAHQKKDAAPLKFVP